MTKTENEVLKFSSDCVNGAALFIGERTPDVAHSMAYKRSPDY